MLWVCVETSELCSLGSAMTVYPRDLDSALAQGDTLVVFTAGGLAHFAQVEERFAGGGVKVILGEEI